MVPNNRSQLGDSPFVLSESTLAAQIGEALQDQLGASRRATKTVMRWTGVSDTTARAWLHGRASPSGLHLLELASHSEPVMVVLLRLTGHEDLELGLRLRDIESGLQKALDHVRAIAA
ncbi:MAG: hypothetical protein RL702_2569 [Pseudomonadota bacterium]|jgi:hypothetical protein